MQVGEGRVGGRDGVGRTGEGGTKKMNEIMRTEDLEKMAKTKGNGGERAVVGRRGRIECEKEQDDRRTKGEGGEGGRTGRIDGENEDNDD